MVLSNIGVLVLCVPIYVIVFRNAGRGQYRTALFLILVASLTLRLYAASDRCLHMWDERYHALVAKHLITHPLTPTLFESPVLDYDLTNWTANHVWLEKGPIPLWALSGSLAALLVAALNLLRVGRPTDRPLAWVSFAASVAWGAVTVGFGAAIGHLADPRAVIHAVNADNSQPNQAQTLP